MLKNDTLINGTSRIDLYGSAPPPGGDKSEQLVVINTIEYDSKMETILQGKSQYVEVELDPSQHFKSKVLTWADEHLKSNDIDDITYKFITDVNPKPDNAYGLMKCHKENRP